ncbi:MAG: hypothetical protein II254_02380 [Oscillospiraceae bacterium]|nr:hypothetical protein [Oscillospiraceae bacterium]
MKKILSMLMALALILSLAACGNDEPVKDNSGGEIPSGNGNLLGGKGDGEKEPEPSENPEDEPENFDQSYADLIENLSWGEASCGVAYVGFVEGPVGDGYRAILEEQKELMEWYPFVAEIPAERIVETDGYDLYCIVPASLDYSVKVEEISLPEGTEAWEPIIGEIIYESKTGEPILLKCNESDIFTNVLVTITTPDGKEKKISPYLSLMDGSLAGINEDESELTALDFSRYEINLENYCKIINIEALTMIEMVKRDILPAVSAYSRELTDVILSKKSVSTALDCSYEEETATAVSNLTGELFSNIKKLDEIVSESEKISDMSTLSFFCKDTIIPAMKAVREATDSLEVITASEFWPYPTYGDLLFGVR